MEPRVGSGRIERVRIRAGDAERTAGGGDHGGCARLWSLIQWVSEGSAEGSFKLKTGKRLAQANPRFAHLGWIANEDTGKRGNKNHLSARALLNDSSRLCAGHLAVKLDIHHHQIRHELHSHGDRLFAFDRDPDDIVAHAADRIAEIGRDDLLIFDDQDSCRHRITPGTGRLGPKMKEQRWPPVRV